MRKENRKLNSVHHIRSEADLNTLTDIYTADYVNNKNKNTILPSPWPLCGAVCRSAVGSPSAASLWRRWLHTKEKQLLNDDLHRFLRASASPAADNGKHPDQYCRNLMGGDDRRLRGRNVYLYVYLTHPWACTAPRWWRWQWRCASPRRWARWRPLPGAACHGASGAATAHWQSTPAGPPRCLKQRTCRQQAAGQCQRPVQTMALLGLD